MDPLLRLRRPAAPSPLFQIPAEIRLLIYEFVFSSPLPSAEQAPLPRSSTTLEPLLTSRDFYQEARLIAFACTIHNLNWARASSCLRRLRILEPAQHAHIRHVALATSTASLYDRLLPLRHHFDHNQPPHLSLESLTIVLDVPDTSTPLAKARRVQEQNMVFASIWYFKNVKKVILMNILHKDDTRNHPGMRGEWICMNDEMPLPASVNGPLFNTCLIESIRWRFELTNFYDYAWKPWHGSDWNAGREPILGVQGPNPRTVGGPSVGV